MERIMSVEDKIRRAEAIYERRKQGNNKQIASINVSDNNKKKDIKLLKKMIIQILVCMVLYLIVYTIQNNSYVFSEDFINKANEILSYDTNFSEIYNNLKNGILSLLPKENNEVVNVEENNNTQNEQNNELQNSIGGAVEENSNEVSNEEVEPKQELSQTEQDIINVKNTTTFIKPVEGVISSKFGNRETATGNVPKNHTGTDIAANLGTKIKSATNGEIVLASEEGDYGKHLKIQIGEVSIIYAHCNNLYVKQGDMVVQGQEIAEVGSTGNSTGPHLHFEIRYQERKIDPESILEL